jgi:hypothetical protein
MIGFNTVLPLSADTSVSHFLSLCRKWQEGSPFRTLPLDDREIYDGLRYTSDLESLEFVLVEAESGIHCGVRHVRKDEDGEWWTDVIGCKTDDAFTVAVVSSRSHFDLATDAELPKTPYIVGMLIRETGPMFDDGVQIETAAKEVTADNLPLIAQLLNCERQNRLPVVYVSKPFFGADYLVDPIRLGQRLGGLAHVFYETDSDVSKTLRDLTDGKNAYNGSIGIYWPNRNYKRFFVREESGVIDRKIQNYIKRVLNTRRTPDECRWSHLQRLKFQQKVERHRAGAEEAEILLEYALEDNEKMREQLKHLEAENLYLREQAQMFYSGDLDAKTAIVFKGNEPELFPNEQAELVLDVLEEKLRTGNCSVRIRNMLASILDANERTNNKDAFLAQLKAVLTESGGLSAKGKRELIRMGFELTEDGKHYKLAIKNDGRYAHPISKTPSEYRSQENNFSQLKKRFF